jgi:superoxide oxidase
MNSDTTSPRTGFPPRQRHQTLTIALHWITALLVLTQIALAILHGQASDAEMRHAVLAAHRSLGVVIWYLVIGRLAWRLLGMRLVAFPANMPRWHQWGARFSERVLYGLLLAQPLSGMAADVLRGRPFNLFGIQVSPLIAPDKVWAAAAEGLHTLGAYSLVALVLVHAGAAILHRVIADDGVLDSMLPLPRKRRSAPIESASEA